MQLINFIIFCFIIGFLIYIFSMEKFKNKPFGSQSSNFLPTSQQIKLSVAKKRPQTTKLDLEKLLQESIQLTTLHNNLIKENAKLKQQYCKVQSTKLSRQNLISTVQKAVKEKVHELPNKKSQHSSWLVFKLNRQIYELKHKIELKQKNIRSLKLSKQSQLLRQKQVQLECLQEIIQWANEQNLLDEPQSGGISEETIKEAVWMEHFLRSQQRQLLEIETLYEEQDREVKRIMEELAVRKIDLKNIKEMEEEYHKAQERFKEEKKKKESKMAGNKTYITQLQQQRNQQLKKLDELKIKFNKIEDQQNREIRELQNKLASLQQEYEQKRKTKNQFVLDIAPQQKSKPKLQKWTKHIKYDDVVPIASYLNHSLSLKRVSKQKFLEYFFQDDKNVYNILEIMDKLKEEPFALQNQQEREILARYMVQQSEQGTFLLDLETVQDSPIIKSIFSKVVGKIRVYSEEEQILMYERVGDILSKFHSLITHAVQNKQGARKIASKQRLMEAFQFSQLELTNDDRQFIVLYLFSFSGDINKLELSKMESLGKNKVKWIQWRKEGKQEDFSSNKDQEKETEMVLNNPVEKVQSQFQNVAQNGNSQISQLQNTQQQLIQQNNKNMSFVLHQEIEQQQ